MKFLFLIFMLLQALNAAAAAPVYKWIDEDGQVHYGSKAEHKNAEEIEIKNRYIDSGNVSAPLSAQERAEKLKRFNNALDEEKKSISDEKRKKEEQAELKIKRCKA